MISERAFGLSSGVTPTGMNLPTTRRGVRCASQVALLAATLLSLTHMSFAADTTRTGSEERLAVFRKAYSITVFSVGEYGVPTCIQGTLSAGAQLNPAVEQMYTFLERNRDLFKMQGPRAELLPVQDYLDGRTRMRHIKLQQLHQGVEVYGARLAGHYSPEGLLTTIDGRYYPDLALPATPVIRLADAERLVMGDSMFLHAAPSVRSSELIIFPFLDTLYLAWRITIAIGAAGAWEYFVDALRGDIIFRHSLLRYESSSSSSGDVGGQQSMDSAARYHFMHPDDSALRARQRKLNVPSQMVPQLHVIPSDRPEGTVPPRQRPTPEPGDSLKVPLATPPPKLKNDTSNGATPGAPSDEPDTLSIPLHLRRPQDSTRQRDQPESMSSGVSQTGTAGWVDIMREGFEGQFPSGRWELPVRPGT